MLVVFLTNDLVFPSRVAGAVRGIGARMETAATAEALLAKIVDGAAEGVIVLIDLNALGVAPEKFVPQLKSLTNPPRAIIAFGPHVHEGKLAAAKSAGCDAVLSRGQFDSQMETVLQRFLEEEPK